MLPLALLLLLPPYTSALTLSLPSSPPPQTSQYLPPDLASFSIEFAFLPAFLGNASSPNALTRALLGEIGRRTGRAPSVRVGGITADSSVYDASASAETLDESASGGIYRTTYGPDFFQSLAVLDPQTSFIFDLNFGNNSLDIALAEAQAAYAGINASQLYAFELGNEPDNYNSAQRDVSTWDAQTYTTQWVNWTTTIQSSLSLTAPSFVALSVSDDPTPSAPITAVNCVQDGIASGGTVKAISMHMYQYSTCDPVRNALATLPNLVNHANITAYVDLWKPQIAAAQSVGAAFVVGEFNSVSCSGKEGVTDTFGQALWIVDTILYGASLNITKFFLHQGATLVLQSSEQLNTPGFSHYDTWLPSAAPFSSDEGHASPSYVAFLMLAEAVGAGGRSRIAALDLTGDGAPASLAAYAVWDDAVQDPSLGPARLVLLNMEIYNASSPSPRPSISISLSIALPSSSSTTAVQLKRLTAPGVDSTDATLATWAGQQFYNGTAVGAESVETAPVGEVGVAAGEGVLVFLVGGTANGTASATGAGPTATATAKSGAMALREGGRMLGAVAAAAGAAVGGIMLL